MSADFNKVIEHIRTVCEDNANSPNPEMVLEFIERIVLDALRYPSNKAARRAK